MEEEVEEREKEKVLWGGRGVSGGVSETSGVVTEVRCNSVVFVKDSGYLIG